MIRTISPKHSPNHQPRIYLVVVLMGFFFNKTLVKILEVLVNSIQPKYLSTGFYFLDMFGRFEKVFLPPPPLGILQRLPKGLHIR